MFHFTVQAAKHINADAVCKIADTVLHSEIPFDRLKRLYVEILEDVEQIVMVAVNSAHTVGFIHARRVSDLVYGSRAEIVTVALLPYYQRRGGGTALLFGVEQWSRQMLITDLKCAPKSDNEAVKHLLKRCGYIENELGVYEKTII